MATYRSGANSRIVIGKEATFNTADPTPVGHVLRKAQFTFGKSQGRIDNPELRSGPHPGRTIAGRDRVTATIQMPVTVDEMGLLFSLFFGDLTTTTTSAPYTHTGKLVSAEPPSCWVEVGDTEVSKYDLFNGLVVQSISFGTIDKSQDGLVMATVTFWASGKATRNGASPQDASPDSYTNKLHAMADCLVKTDNATTAVISTTSLTLNRTISGYSVLDGTAYDTEVDLGRMAYDCTVTGWRDSGDTLFALCNGTERTYELITYQDGGTTYYVSVKFPECDYLDTEGPQQVTDGPYMATVRVSPYYENDAAATSCVVTIVSDVADFSAVW